MHGHTWAGPSFNLTVKWKKSETWTCTHFHVNHLIIYVNWLTFKLFWRKKTLFHSFQIVHTTKWQMETRSKNTCFPWPKPLNNSKTHKTKCDRTSSQLTNLKTLYQIAEATSHKIKKYQPLHTLQKLPTMHY